MTISPSPTEDPTVSRRRRRRPYQVRRGGETCRALRRPAPRRVIVFLCVAVLAPLLAPPPLNLSPPAAEAAIPVFDGPNFGQNLLTALRTAQAVLQRIQMIRHQIEQVRLQVLSLKHLADPIVRQVLGVLSDIERELERTREALVFTLSRRDLDERFVELYPAAEPAEHLAHAELARVEAGLATARAALQATRELTESFPTAQHLLGGMKERLLAAEGHLGALQSVGLITSWVGEEVSLLNEQTAITNNLLALVIAHGLATRENAWATLSRAVADSRREVPPYAAVEPVAVLPPGFPTFRGDAR